MCAALDPVLVAAGFLAGQGGEDGRGGGQVIFCIAHDELCRRYPHLPQAMPADAPGGCDDLVADICADGSLGRLDLEGTSLAETLRLVGLDEDSDAVTGLVGQPVVDGLPALTRALRQLFGVAS